MRDLKNLNDVLPKPEEAVKIVEWLSQNRATVHFGIGQNRDQLIIEWKPVSAGSSFGFTPPRAYTSAPGVSLETAVLLIWQRENSELN
jgi:hypothetical protein